MVGPSSTIDQNILPVQAYFNLDGSFNTFIGQGQPFVVSATESIGIINTSVNGTFYPTFTAVNTGSVTSLSVASLNFKFNPGTGELSAPFFDGTLNGTATEANNIAGGSASQLVYQTGANTTGFVPNGISGQFLVSNGTSAPSWSSVATSVTIVDQTSSSSTFYPLFYSATSGSTNTVETSSTKLQYVPSTGTLISTVFSGSGAGLTNIPNSALTNASFTLGSTSIALGSTTTTIAGLVSVTSTTFVGALSGNATTATSAVTATNANNVAITDNTSSVSTWYPTIVSNTTGNLPETTSSTKLSFVPNTGILSATGFSGSGAGLTNISASSITGTISLTTQVTGILPIANGGTNTSSTPTAGGSLYGTGTAYAITPVGTSGNALISAGSSAPAFGNLAIGVANTNISGALTVTNGGTGLNTLTTNYIPYGNGTNAFQFSSGFTFDGTNLQLASANTLNWNSDTYLRRDAANIVAQYNSTNAQAWKLYNTRTDASNYERLSVDWTTTANTATISTQNAGTGSARNLAIGQDLYVNGVTVGRGAGNISTNTVFGNNAAITNSAGINLSSFGYQSLNINTASGNSAFGSLTLSKNTIASNLTAIGYQSLQANTTNVATLGAITGGTLYTTGTYTNVVMTLSSGSTAITYPTATIVVAGGAVTTVTLTSNGVGFKDTTTVLTAPAASIGGTGSGFSVPVATLQSGTGNVAVGYQAGYTNSTGVNNTFTGYQAGFNNTTSNYGTFVGYQAGYLNTTGASNTGLGNLSLYSNQTGQANVSIGQGALYTNTNSSNVAVGLNCLYNNSSGANNTAIGRNAGVGNSSPNANSTGNNNTYIGYQTVGSANNNTNENVFGNLAVGLGSNTTVIGNTSTTLTQTYGVTKSTNYTVATLPSASTSGVGARAFVTDALAPSFGVTVVTGGAIATPVYSDGTNWKVG